MTNAISNARLCIKNSVDDDRLVMGCSVVQIKPVENLRSVARGKVFRVGVGSGIEVTGHYGGDAIRATMFALLRYNLEPGAMVQFLGYSDYPSATLVIDTGLRDPVPSGTLGDLDFGIEALGSSLFDPYYGQKWMEVFFDDEDMVLFSSNVICSWKILISDPFNTAGFLDISRAWVGKHIELDSNPVIGAAFGWVDESQAIRTDGGGVHTDATAQYRAGKFDPQNFPEADRTAWADATRFCGAGRRPFYFSMHPNVPQSARSLFASGEFIFKNPLPQLSYSEAEGGLRYNTSVNIEET